jgi:O-antigen/teichoic acid export membrane protein
VMLLIFQVPIAKALVAVLFAASIAFFELGQEILRAQQRVQIYVSGSLTRSGLSLTLCLAAVLAGGGGLALGLAMVTGYVVAALLLAPKIWQRPRQAARWETLVTLARYGLPITVSGLFVALTLVLDRFALFYLIGTEAAGVYGATAEFVRQCAILPAVSASLAIAPLAVATLDKNDGVATTRHLAEGAELLLAVMIPAAVGLAIAAPQVAGTILGPEYRSAATGLIPFLAFAFMAHMISQQYVQLSFALANQPQKYIWHTGSIFLINLVLMLPLIGWFGIAGAASAFLLSESSGVIIGLWMARRTYALPPIGWPLLRIAGAATVMAIVVFAMRQWLERTDVVGLAAIVLTGGVAYVAAALALNVVRSRQHVLTLLHLTFKAGPSRPPQA